MADDALPESAPSVAADKTAPGPAELPARRDPAPERVVDRLQWDHQFRKKYQEMLALKRRRLFSPQAVRHGPLRAWMRTYARLLVEQPRFPKAADRLRLARQAAKSPDLKASTLRLVEAREDFQALLDEFQNSAIAAAKATLEEQAGFYVEAHRWGVAKAMEDGDHRAIPAFTTPLLDRIWPKQEPTVPVQPVIHLTVHAPSRSPLLATPDDDIVEAQIERIDPA